VPTIGGKVKREDSGLSAEQVTVQRGFRRKPYNVSKERGKCCPLRSKQNEK